MFISPCSADGGFEVSFKSNVIVNASGNIMWIPPSIFKSSCKIDVEYFPFDEQICRMEFSSWTYNSRQLKLGFYDDISFVNLNDYTFSGTWTIVACPAYIRETKNTTEEETKEVFTFFLKLRRKPLFYTVNMIVPCVLISFMSICVFYLPADAGEKMTMCISIMLALVVFILLLSKILPPTAVNVPLIAKFLLFAFIMNIMSVLLTVFIVNWNFRTPRTHRMGKWTRLIFLYYLPKLLLMKRPDHDDKFDKTCPEKAASAATHKSSTSQMELLHCGSGGGGGATENRPDIMQHANHSHHHHHNQHHTPQHHQQCPLARASLRHQSSVTSQGGAATPMAPEINKAIEAVRFVAAHLKNEDDYHEVRL